MRKLRPINDTLKMHRKMPDGMDDKSFLSAMALYQDTMLWGQIAVAQALHYLVSGTKLTGENVMPPAAMKERNDGIIKSVAGLSDRFRVAKTDVSMKVSAPLSVGMLPEMMLINQTPLGRRGAYTTSMGGLTGEFITAFCVMKGSRVAQVKEDQLDGVRKLIAFIESNPDLMDASKQIAEIHIPASVLYKHADEEFIRQFTESFVEFETTHKENCGGSMLGARLLFVADKHEVPPLKGYYLPDDLRERAKILAHENLYFEDQWLAERGLASDPFIVEYKRLAVAMSRNVRAFLDFNVRAEEVEVLCQAPFSDLRPQHMAMWCQQLSAGYKSGNYSYETKAVEFIAADVKAYQGPKAPRTSKEGLSTLKNGDVWYLPDVDNIKEMADKYGTYQGADGLDDFTFKSDAPVNREACAPEESDVTTQERNWAAGKMREWLYAHVASKGDGRMPRGVVEAFNRLDDNWDNYFKFVRAWADEMGTMGIENVRINRSESASVLLLILRSIQHVGVPVDTKFKDAIEGLARRTQEPFSKAVTKPIENLPVFVDWVNNKLVYTNTSGQETTLDLTSVMPTTATHILNKLNCSLKDDEGNDEVSRDVVFTIGQVLKLAVAEGFQLNLADPKYGLLQASSLFYGSEDSGRISLKDLEAEIVNNGNVLKFIARVRQLRGYIGAQQDREAKLPADLDAVVKQWPQVVAAYGDAIEGYELFGGALPFVGPLADAAQHLIGKGWDTLDGIYDKFNRHVEGALSTKLKIYAQLYIIINAFKPNRFVELQAEDAALRAAYINPVISDPTKQPPLTSAGKNIVAMPHQGRIRSQLIANRPKYAYIEVAAGGGKTIQILSDVLDSLTAGIVNMPVIVCPGYLVKDYVKEANFLTEGRLNVIPINTDSIANYSYERMYEVIANSPPNTVVVVSYDFLAGKYEEQVYGRTTISVFNNVEFLRQFLFDGAWFDEAHNLRKSTSNRTNAVRAFVADIPILRLASGTSAVDQVTDIVSQFSLVDPTVFGDLDDFIAEYAEETRGGKVVRWKPMAEIMVRRKMGEHCMILSAKRREWAALLPERKESFFFVKLTPNQRSLYQAILEETIEEIKENNPQLVKMMNEGDESNSDLLEAILGPYLQRLEQFMSAPSRDKSSIALKTKEDLTSPKAVKVTERVREHIKNRIPGKILVFTSYKASAEEIYKALPDDIRKQFIHYTAENKIACEKEFASNPDKIGMIGVENSMNTGLNLQFCSRLIRVESVWSPGLMEQGESRVNRPNLKVKEFRDGLYFDWILVDNSIDITKVGRLIAKQVSNARYENWDNPSYLGLTTPPLVSMNLDSILANNSFEEELVEHFDSLQQLIECRKEDYSNWRTDPNAFKTAVPLKPGKLLPGSKLLLNPPYCPGMSIYNASDLMLEDLNVWRLTNSDDDLVGRTIHCEFGDVEVVRVNKRTVQVRLPDGKRKGVPLEAAWVIHKDRDDPRQTRLILQEMVGLSDHVYVPNYYEEDKKPIKLVPLKKAAEIDPNAKDKPELDRKGLIPQDSGVPDGEVLLYATVINNRLALCVDADEPDIEFKELKKYGFGLSGPSKYVWAEAKYARHLRAIIDGLTSKFEVADRYLNVLEELYETFTEGRQRLLNVEQAHAVEFKDFMRMRFRQCGPKELRPYPMLQDGSLYVVMEADKCPAALKVPSRVKIPGAPWEVENSPFFVRWCSTKRDLQAIVKEMRKDGVKIGNMDDLKADVAEVRLLPPIKRDV